MVVPFSQGLFRPQMIDQDVKDRTSLLDRAVALQVKLWADQSELGIRAFPANDVVLTDPMHQMAAYLGVVEDSLPSYGAKPYETKKWFSGDAEFYVPQVDMKQKHAVHPCLLENLLKLAKEKSASAVPVLIGPLTMMAWCQDAKTRKPIIQEWQRILPLYLDLLAMISQFDVEYIQFDEPVLTHDLPSDVLDLGAILYGSINNAVKARSILSVYYGGLGPNLKKVMAYDVDIIHFDLVHDAEQYSRLLDNDQGKIFSLGVIDSLSSGTTHLANQLKLVERSVNQIGLRRTMVSLNGPLYFLNENDGAPFETAEQKLKYLTIIAKAMNEGKASVQSEIEENLKKHMTK